MNQLSTLRKDWSTYCSKNERALLVYLIFSLWAQHLMSLKYRFFFFFYVSNFQSLVFLYMSYKELKYPKVGFGALYVIHLQPC